MKKFPTYLLALLFIIVIDDLVMAQTHNCGMSSDDLQEVKRQMFQNRRELANFVPNRNMTTYVPIRFHLVADGNGEGRATERQALIALCNMNNSYSEHDIQFYLEEFNYINSNSLYDNPAFLNVSVHMVYNAVNIFVVGADLGSGGGIGVVQAYYQPPAGSGGNDWIVCNKSFLTDKYVLSHEMGHFFSLPHPFNGWDFEEWSASSHGNPVLMSTAPNGQTEIELVDGSNCNEAGDGICDTPADYNFGLTFNSGCNYTGNCRDANNDELTPLEENVMNYFGCNTQSFTSGQVTEMHNSLNASNRNYCTPNYTPNTAIIEGGTTLITPAFGATVPNYNYVNLEWEAKAGATHYIVEIIGDPSFNLIVEDNKVGLENLLADKTYLWRVQPFNESYGCASSSQQRVMKTGDQVTNVSTIEQIDELTVTPNPVANGQELRININASETFDAQISLIDVTGRIVQSVNNQTFQTGNDLVRMDIDNLNSGLYIISIQSKNGIMNKRLVISN